MNYDTPIRRTLCSTENQSTGLKRVTIMSVIVPGAASAGQFVKTLQGQTGVGFQDGFHVHKDWFAKTMTYEQAHVKLESARGERVDIMAKRSHIEAVVDQENSCCKILVQGQTFDPTPHAMSQIGAKISVSTQFLQEMRNPLTKVKTTKGVKEDVIAHNRDVRDAEILADVINNGLRRVENDKIFRVRTYKDGTLRAFLTDSYAEIDNRQYLDIVSSIIPEGRVSHFRGDADEVWANILIPDTIMKYQDDDSDYGGMIMCSNSEIGTGPVYQAPSTFRSICLNGCIWGQTTGQKSRWVHRGAVDYLELHKAIHENIDSQIPLLVPYITAMQEAKKLLFDSTRFVQIVGVIAKENGLSKPQAIEIVKQFSEFESDQRNAFGILNAVTRAGQFFDARTCIKFDGIGGNIVNPKTWNAYITKAKVFSEKDMLAVFGNGLAV